jgi:pyruvate formate lyase activating enzyme
MKIAGFQPISLCDYPGKVAAVVFTQGCNLRCGFCHNGGLIPMDAAGARLFCQGDLVQRLAERAGLLDAVVVSGGEPTLQGDLAEFCQQVKRLGLLVKLDTNGTRPDVLKALFDGGCLDFVAMDIKAPLDRYAMITGVETNVALIMASIHLIAASGIRHEFRTTFVRPLLTGEDLEAVRSALPPGSPHRVQAFVPELAADPRLRLAS